MKTTKTGVMSPIQFRTKLISGIECAIVCPQNVARFKRTVPGMWFQVGKTNLWVNVLSNPMLLIDAPVN